MNKKEKPVLTVENYILNWKYTCNDFIVENRDFFFRFGKIWLVQRHLCDKIYGILLKVYEKNVIPEIWPSVENYTPNWKYTCNDVIVDNSDFFLDFWKFDCFQDKQEDVVIELYIFTQSFWRIWYSFQRHPIQKAPLYYTVEMSSQNLIEIVIKRLTW